VNEEIFDVVNDRDEVIDKATRSDVHRRGLMHRATHVLVFNSKGEVFLQKRSLKKDRQPGLWDSSASGHVDSGEEYDACAVRELREELGLDVRTPLQRLFKLGASAETDQEHVWVYRCEAEGPFQLNAEEIERGDWFTVEEVTLDGRKITEVCRRVIAHLANPVQVTTSRSAANEWKGTELTSPVSNQSPFVNC
jgi:isopentenyldiphosphate isomerase